MIHTWLSTRTNLRVSNLCVGIPPLTPPETELEQQTLVAWYPTSLAHQKWFNWAANEPAATLPSSIASYEKQGSNSTFTSRSTMFNYTMILSYPQHGSVNARQYTSSPLPFLKRTCRCLYTLQYIVHVFPWSEKGWGWGYQTSIRMPLLLGRLKFCLNLRNRKQQESIPPRITWNLNTVGPRPKHCCIFHTITPHSTAECDWLPRAAWGVPYESCIFFSLLVYIACTRFLMLAIAFPGLRPFGPIRVSVLSSTND